MAGSKPAKSASLMRTDGSEIVTDPVTIRADTTLDEEVKPNSSAYIGNMNDYDRLEMVLKYMRDKHRWSINDLLRHMVTAKPGKPYDQTIKTRVKLLSGAIAQEQVAEQLVRYSDELHEIGVSGLVERLRSEINRLGSSVTGLGNFDPEASSRKIPVRGTGSRPVKAITIISASIAYAYAPNTYDNFPVLLGVHLHAMGVKRRTLNVLAGLGLIPSYQTIMRRRAEPPRWPQLEKYHTLFQQIKGIAQSARQRIIISWDNFDYSETVRHQSLWEPAKHICATTGKLCISQNLPGDGLHKSMFRPHLALDPNDVCFMSGNRDDEILHQTQRYWIAEAIRDTHRDAIHDTFTDELDGWPQFQCVERLLPQNTRHYSLGPILENEALSMALTM
ncbi:hypothetical protein PHISCL_05051 [Aspergillus sclerotialis]|uniref:Uncharacterized protein n=1 Tax=Aspergillus sclerotialis TaxID=2070753 RepID=A0A3A2ZHD5_9EURO|nr:hypothetical protein PHISCL_05051 [Aspergillus sclerotialis]